MDKASARELQDEFIPRGGAVIQTDAVTYRRTTNTEVFRCSIRTGYDPQSGPMYCGRIADFVGEVYRNGRLIGQIAMCGTRGHVPPPGTLQKG